MTDIAIDIANVQRSIENTIHDYRTLAGKATRNDSNQTGVLAALVILPSNSGHAAK